MTPNIALFICSILNASAKIYGYAYNEKRSQKALKKETILLPVKSDETIDFEYMENYIDKCAVKAKENITRAQIIANKQTNKQTNKPIDTSKWKKFHLYDGLFDIDMGTKLDKAKMSDINPSVNFVGRANANNGITTCHMRQVI